ncbi:MAG TPA: hypothetical protein VJB15_10235 [Rhodothermia bacterium]|nr:hypothetical protein [Rhodothermia bacterium]
MWEQFHRWRRSRNRREVPEPSASGEGPRTIETPAQSEASVAVAGETPGESPTLRLVPDNALSLPNLSGRKLSAIRFLSGRVELDFSGVIVLTTDSPVVVIGLQRLRYPDAGSRDALCSLIGAAVEAARAAPGERLELRMGQDRQLIVPHARSRSVAVGSRT